MTGGYEKYFEYLKAIQESFKIVTYVIPIIDETRKCYSTWYQSP